MPQVTGNKMRESFYVEVVADDVEELVKAFAKKHIANRNGTFKAVDIIRTNYGGYKVLFIEITDGEQKEAP